MKQWVNSAGHAWRGILLFFQTERNARIELVIAVIAITLGFICHITLVEWCILLLVIGGVFATEALNSAIERLADLHTRETRPEIRALKDMSAGAVMIMSLASLIIGLLILGPRLFSIIFG